MTPIIGLSGYARSGKDAAARALVAAGWKRASFADRVRELALVVQPELAGDVARVGWEATKERPEVRALLQRLGVGVRDIVDEDCWVTAAFRSLPVGPVVFTDCRFPNEARAISRRGGIVVRVVRPGLTPMNGHITDTALEHWPFDAVIVNDGTLEDLHARARQLATDWVSTLTW
ncbi:MAG: deoxynucleotide monophosphate kinase family protein [Oryzihumus sp.]